MNTKKSRPAGAFATFTLIALALLLGSCGDEPTPLAPDGPSFSSGTVSGCQTSEEPDPNAPMCQVDGITVRVPSTPNTSEPPPDPPDPTYPPYTPGGEGGGFGSIWTWEGGDLEVIAPEPTEGPFADGPWAYVTCIGAAVGFANLAEIPDVLSAGREMRYRLRQLNQAEVEFQAVYENRNIVGEELLIHYQDMRNMAQEEYNHSRENFIYEVNQWKAVSSIALVGAIVTCTPTLWIPGF